MPITHSFCLHAMQFCFFASNFFYFSFCVHSLARNIKRPFLFSPCVYNSAHLFSMSSVHYSVFCSRISRPSCLTSVTITQPFYLHANSFSMQVIVTEERCIYICFMRVLLCQNHYFYQMLQQWLSFNSERQQERTLWEYWLTSWPLHLSRFWIFNYLWPISL